MVLPLLFFSVGSMLTQRRRRWANIESTAPAFLVVREEQVPTILCTGCSPGTDVLSTTDLCRPGGPVCKVEHSVR